jgi:hypothetical protein
MEDNMKCQTCGKVIEGWCMIKSNKGWCYNCYTNSNHDEDDENGEFEEDDEEETFSSELIQPDFQKIKINYMGGSH